MPRGGFRVGSGRPKGSRDTKPRKRKINAEKQAIPKGIMAEAIAENLDPLAYMLKIMNDPTVDNERRDRMAIVAAPFVHPRIPDGLGKKAEMQERAEKAGRGRFASWRPPALRPVK